MGEWFDIKVEVRWHGRGGQGAKTASLLLAEVLANAGFYIQAFPEYGPERMGAPLVAFNRISNEPIVIRGTILEPDIVTVLDATLLGKAGVFEGLKPQGVLLVNTPLSPEEILKKHETPATVITVDANKIAKETIGREIPNTPMIGALVSYTGIISTGELITHLEPILKAKFRNRPELLSANLKAVRLGGEGFKVDPRKERRVTGVVR